jgi:KUP system potassium uptake protein
MTTSSRIGSTPVRGEAGGGAPSARTSPWRTLLSTSLAALGVVYGDIGTSPLYALRECFTPPHAISASAPNVLGALSLFFWSLTLVVSVKYLTFVLRADNDGEGGVLALLALLGRSDGASGSARAWGSVLALLGVFGAALLYGDGVITPAISVLSAVEGLGVATHMLDPFVVPVTAVILVALFLMQRRGTASVGGIFGPVVATWFATLVATGLPWVIRHPEVLSAIDPRHAIRFFAHNGRVGFLVLGSVVLCVTGSEALYADMGHFGRRPIRFAWYTVVFPALLVSYFGQGALYLERGPAVTNPFYELVSGWVRWPVVAIATVATVVASQALISGVFSLTRQAIQLGYWPRMTVVHTSGALEGQIYMPEMNKALMIGCVLLVFAFGSSSRLAAAYGVSVTGTMTITTILYFAVVRRTRLLRPALAVVLFAVFLTVDVAFFSANLGKLRHGGWFTALVAAGIFALMTTWKRGREELGKLTSSLTLPFDAFMASLSERPIHRIPGTGVFMTSNPNGVTPVLLHHVKHNRVLHEHVVLLFVSTSNAPETPPERRATIKPLGQGFFQMQVEYGFMESPDIPGVLRQFGRGLFPVEPLEVTYYFGRETLLTTGPSRMAPWRKRLFVLMSRNAQSATAFFKIPPNRVVELGAQLEL